MYIIKRNDTVYFATLVLPAPHSAHADNGVRSNAENLLIWRAPNDDDIMVMTNNCSIVAEIIKYDPDFFAGTLTYDRMVTELIPKLKGLCDEVGLLSKRKRIPYRFAVAQNDRAYYISNLFECDEVECFRAAYYNSDVATSALKLSRDKTPDESLRFVKQALEYYTDNSSMPMLVMNTATLTPYWIK